MSVEVGQTLDKYELLERVGHGGMAVVYRGLDRSLRREVAVKVLHQHLAEHREARERFEREAHAVAKLRHENILEIYDFSGTESDESYIVTEFIDGESLKEFITDHEVRHPEVGAMLAVQVCRALEHAHGHGILHRDVKPENIMIRTDGVVKLTDFGIAQMIDLQRLTVTGQLLGSPAYMSPEHVDGGRLDFRTDVFAVGIVLYQLVTSELPFKGKNPHQILKRIAEGEFLDPQVVNPLVGRDLARIICTAMARDKDDRYADVALLMVALERYLGDCGLADFRSELGTFFADPRSYETKLEDRLIETLTRRGKQLVETDQIAALEAFNRVLTMDPDNAEVLAEIDRLGRRRRALRVVAMFCAVLVAGGAAWAAKRAIDARTETRVLGALTIPAESMAPIDAAVVVAERADAASEAPLPADAGAVIAAVVRDAGIVEPRVRDAGERIPPADATLAERQIRLSVYPLGSEYRIAGGGWRKLEGRSATITIPGGAVTITARNPMCCESKGLTVPAEAAEGGSYPLTLPFKNAEVIPVCGIENVRVSVDGRRARLGRPTTVFVESATGIQPATVEFYTDDKSFYKTKSVRVGFNQTQRVTCEP